MHHPPTPVVTGAVSSFLPFAFASAPAGLGRSPLQGERLHWRPGGFPHSQLHPAAFLHANYTHMFGAGLSGPRDGTSGTGHFQFVNSAAGQTTCSPGEKMAEPKSFTIDAILGRKKQDATSGEMIMSSGSAGEEVSV